MPVIRHNFRKHLEESSKKVDLEPKNAPLPHFEHNMDFP